MLLLPHFMDFLLSRLFVADDDGPSKRTVDLYRAHFNRYVRFAEPRVDYVAPVSVSWTPDDDLEAAQAFLDPPVVAQYLREKAESGASPGTLANSRSAIRFVVERIGVPDPWDDPRVRAAWDDAMKPRPEPEPPPSLVVLSEMLDPQVLALIRAASPFEGAVLGLDPEAYRLPKVYRGSRDVAVLSVMSGARLGPSATRAMDVGDVELTPSGVRVRTGEGQWVELHGGDPVLALRPSFAVWLSHLGREDGASQSQGPEADSRPLWRGIDRHGNTSSTRISRGGLHALVREAAERAEADPDAYTPGTLAARPYV